MLDALDGAKQLFCRAQVDLAMTAQPARPLGADNGRAGGLAEVQHVIAVSSCKGGMPALWRCLLQNGS